ncbi:NB-ARC domain-containing protein [Tolypothrix sp. VBCCA 56010]|uniref:NB-ARC domain-containing protein n=1 Tax=Tolypothrix sp. VBCCA 56010 TaxID=3137731 RepID=UPI003D7CC41A
MDIAQVITIADGLVYSHTGKHLDDLQESIVRGVYQGKKYQAIANDFGCSEGHVRDIASELWKLLSDLLGEDISKFNFRSAMERQHLSVVSSNIFGDFVQNGHVKVCADTSKPPEVETIPRQQQTSEEKNTDTQRQDLDDAPDITPLHGRTEELNNLKTSIIKKSFRLIGILGINGIGKSTLARHLLEEIRDNFDYVVWRSLGCKPHLLEIQTDLIQLFSNQTEADLSTNSNPRLSQLMKYLRQNRCLIILDDVHSIFRSGQLVGSYQSGYEDYGELFRRVGESQHKSCLLLLSWEKPREIVELEGENRAVGTLQLSGLGEAAREILRNQGLLEEEHWSNLIEYYGGNPLYLKITATMIKDLFGSISELFKYDYLVLNEDLKYKLNWIFNRLSHLEKQVISVIAADIEAVSLSKLIEKTQLIHTDLFSAIQSLKRRFLIEQHQNDKNQILFTIQPLMKQYVNLQMKSTNNLSSGEFRE